MALTSNTACFPCELLTRPVQARLDYFKAYTVAHPALSTADTAVWNALREPAGALLILVFGPTGVGKTTLLAHLEQRLIEQAFPRLDQDPGHIPVVRLDAMAPSARQFKWSDFYTRALLTVHEPLIGDKMRTQAPVFHEKQKRYVVPRSGKDAAALQLAWEQVLHHRRPAAVLIDEAQHFAKMASGSKLLDQLDHLKSLAVTTQTVHILVGTYDLLVFRNLSAQLSRRSIDVHFPRYRAADEHDLRAFKSVLWAFQQHLPLEQAPDLVHQWEAYYERTVGCIGILKDWLTKALAEALEGGEKTLSPTLLQRHAPSVDRCNQMIIEIEEGEKHLAPDEEARYRLRVRLGLERPRAPGGHQENEGMPQRTTASPASFRHTGQRHPTRDPVKSGSETGE